MPGFAVTFVCPLMTLGRQTLGLSSTCEWPSCALLPIMELVIFAFIGCSLFLNLTCLTHYNYLNFILYPSNKEILFFQSRRIFKKETNIITIPIYDQYKYDQCKFFPIDRFCLSSKYFQIL